MQGHAQGQGMYSELHDTTERNPITYLLTYVQISVHSADVKSVLRVFSIEVPAREKDDLKEEPIVIKLRKVRARILTGPSLCFTICTINRRAVPVTMVFKPIITRVFMSLSFCICTAKQSTAFRNIRRAIQFNTPT